jgi:amino acid transporter
MADKRLESEGRSPSRPSTAADVEKLEVAAPAGDDLHRTMSSRHLVFIAIGGAVGTGLFLGSGQALSKTGPVGCLIAYLFMGTIVYSAMTSLGEMATLIPVTGSFTSYASRFVDGSLGFAMGWIYWFSWAITWPLELTAAGIIIQYWRDDLSIGIWIAVFWVVFTAINCLPVRWFAELEMYFASIKVLTIVGFVIFAICINAGAGSQGYLGFRYWSDPGPFAAYLVDGPVGKFVGFASVLIQASFSYQGTELVGVGAGETRDPKRNVPLAIRNAFWGIVLMFSFTIFFIGILVPYTNEQLLSDSSDASASPLVIAANLAGVRVLPDIINAVLLTAVLSAAQSNVYSGSRILVALANEGHAPRFFLRTTRHGLPYHAVAFTTAFGLLAFMNLSDQGGSVFNWFVNIIGVAGLITWLCINLCHLRFMRALTAQNMRRNELPYVAPWQPWLAWYGAFFNALVVITQGFAAFIPWDTTDFFVAYVSLILFVVLYVGHKLLYRTKLIPLAEVDLNRGRLQD